MVTNLRNYRLAKEFEKDSHDFLRAIDLSIKALTHFRHYKPIANILHTLTDQRAILSAHLNTANKILAKKDIDV